MTIISRRHLASVPLEQGDAVFAFEGPDLLPDRSMRDPSTFAASVNDRWRTHLQKARSWPSPQLLER